MSTFLLNDNLAIFGNWVSLRLIVTLTYLKSVLFFANSDLRYVPLSRAASSASGFSGTSSLKLSCASLQQRQAAGDDVNTLRTPCHIAAIRYT